MPYNPYQQAAPVVATPVTSAGPYVPAAHAVAVVPSWHPPATNPDYSTPHASFNQGSPPPPPPPPSYNVPTTPPAPTMIRVMRVPIPDGMQPGQPIRVKTPDGTEVVRAIPPRSEWQYDGAAAGGGRPFFRLQFGGGASPSPSTAAAGPNRFVVATPPAYAPPPPAATTATTAIMRVPIPDGVQAGQQIRVRSPDGTTEVVKTIPSRSEWHYDGTRAFFRVQFGGGGCGGGGSSGMTTTPLLIVPPPSWQQQHTPAAYNPYENPANGPPMTSAVPAAAATYNPCNAYGNPTNGPPSSAVPAAAAAAASSYNPYENPMNGPLPSASSSVASYGVVGFPAAIVGAPTAAAPPPPHSVEWRHFRTSAPSHYDPQPVGVRSVPSVPRGFGPGLPPNGRHKALLVGINYEKSRARLRGCVNDARSMMTLLKRNGYPDDGSHMLLLSDEKSRGPEYQPTTENIVKALKWIMRDVRRGDVLFFHFSGHGGQVPDKTGHETDGYNETILPVDFERKGQITDDVLWGGLVYDLPEGARLTALMDMCHSGTGLDLPYDYDVNARRWREDTNPAHSAGDVVLFSGCEDSQTSADVGGGYNKMAGGAMTQAFTKAYEETAAMSTYHGFLEAVKRQLKSRGFKQRPQLTSSQMFDAESRIFSLGCQMPAGGGMTSYIEPNHNSTIGRDKRRHVRPAREGPFGGRGGNNMLGMAGGILAGAVIADMLF